MLPTLTESASGYPDRHGCHTPIVRQTVEHTHTAVLPDDPKERRRLALTSRECPEGLSAWVQRRCLRSPQLLPRRHQTDRWRARTNNPAGVHYETPEGAYSGIQAWRSREHWLTYVVPTAIALMPEKRAGRVSEDLLRRYLLVRSGYAHASTGRGAIVRPDTLASVLDCTTRQVQNAQRVARDMGLEVVIQKGRMLTWAERMRARRSGSHQRGLATEVAFTSPSHLGKTAVEHVDVFTPPKRSKTSQKSHLKLLSPSAASGDTKDAAPPRASTRRAPAARRAGTRLGEDLRKILPWLRTERPGRLGPPLARFATAATPWSAQDVAIALADLATRRGHAGQLTADHINTRPAVVLAGLLRELDPEADHPTADAFHEQDPEPCNRPDCDHGWLTLDGHRGHTTIAPCPTCPPGVRSLHDEDDTEPEF